MELHHKAFPIAKARARARTWMIFGLTFASGATLLLGMIATTVSVAVSATALDRPDVFGVSAVDIGDHRRQQYDNVPQDQEQNLKRRQHRRDLQIRDGDNGSGSSKTPERGGVAAVVARLSRRSPTVDMTHATPFTGLAGTVLQAATSSVFAGWYQGDATQKAQKGLQEAVKGEHEAGKPSTTQRWAHTLTGGRAGRIENSSKYKFYQEHASNWCYVVCGGKKTHDLQDSGAQPQQRNHRRGLTDKIKSARNKRKGYTSNDKSVRHVHVGGIGPAQGQMTRAKKKVDKQVERGGCAIVHNKS